MGRQTPDVLGFALVPYALMDEAPWPLKGSIHSVYLALHRHGLVAPENGHPLTMKGIGAESGFGPRYVKAAIEWLIEHGWLIKEQTPTGGTSWRVVTQRPWPEDEDEGDSSSPTSAEEG